MEKLIIVCTVIVVVTNAVTALLIALDRLKRAKDYATWSKEFVAAKDETIRAKEEALKVKDIHIATLEAHLAHARALTPMVLQEHYLSATKQLEDVLIAARAQAGVAAEAAAAAHRRAEALEAESAGNAAQLAQERARAQEEQARFRLSLNALQNALESIVSGVSAGTPKATLVRGLYDAVNHVHQTIVSTASPAPEWVTTSAAAVSATGEAVRTVEGHASLVLPPLGVQASGFVGPPDDRPGDQKK